MRKTPQPTKPGLSMQSLSTLKGQLKESVKDTAYRFLLATIASVLDDTASGSPEWISIGRNLQGDSFLLTVHLQGQKVYASGSSLAELAAECASLLEASEMV